MVYRATPPVFGAHPPTTGTIRRSDTRPQTGRGLPEVTEEVKQGPNETVPNLNFLSNPANAPLIRREMF